MKILLTIISSLVFFKAYGHIHAKQGGQETQKIDFQFPEILKIAGGNDPQMFNHSYPFLMAQGSAENTTGEDAAITGPMETDSSSTTTSLVRREPTYDMLNRLMAAESALHSNDLELAFKKYMEVARETWDSSVAARTVHIAKLLGDQEKIDKAIQLQNETDPSNIEASKKLIPPLVQTGNVDGIASHLKLIIERTPNSARNTNPPQHLQGQGSTPVPSQGTLNPIPKKPPSFENILGAGFNFAIRELSKSLKGEHEETAIDAMKKLGSDYGTENVEAQIALALLLAQAERFNEAMSVVEAVTPFSTGNMQITIFRMQLHINLNETHKALDILAKFLRHHPNSETIRFMYASLLSREEQYEKAHDEFEELLKKYPDNYKARYFFGSSLLDANQLDEARQEFEKLTDSDLLSDMANYTLGKIAELQEQDDKAMAFYRKVINNPNTFFRANIRIAILKAKTDLQAGLIHLQSLLVTNGRQSVQLYLAGITIFKKAGRYDEVISTYKQMLNEFPGKPLLLTNYMRFASTIDQLDMDFVERYLNHILAFNPNDADTLNTLGYTLADLTDRYEEAHDLIGRALQIKPDDPFTLDSMGWVLFKMGEYKEALEHLERASSLFLPIISGEIQAHIGEVYWTLGQKENDETKKDKAREIWMNALGKGFADEDVLIKTINRLDPETFYSPLDTAPLDTAPADATPADAGPTVDPDAAADATPADAGPGSSGGAYSIMDCCDGCDEEPSRCPRDQ